MTYLQKFRNVTYPYKNQDDTFTARGYHLNILVDAVNGGGDSLELELGTTDIILGPSANIKGVDLLYSALYPTYAPGNRDSAGEITIANGNDSDTPTLSWYHDSTFDNTSVLTLTPMIVGSNLILRVENLIGDILEFGLNAKTVTI